MTSAGSALSVYDATAEALGGGFDLVFCGSVLIHLRDPMLALERLAALCRGRLILAEEYSRRLAWLPFGRGGVPRRDAVVDLVAPVAASLAGDGPLRRVRGRPRARPLPDGPSRGPRTRFRTSSSTQRRREGRDERRAATAARRPCRPP